jgi:hypothetical protein
MQETLTGRALLESIIDNPTERGRIAEALGVRSITLTRWILLNG